MIFLILYFFNVIFWSITLSLCEDSLKSNQYETHHRVRRFVFAKNSKVSFDVELMLPIPSFDGVSVQAIFDFPLSITMLNDTSLFSPLLNPNSVPLGYPSFMPNYYSYDTFFGSGQVPYTHLIMKRSLAAASALHRYDLFNSIADILNSYGFDGHNCIKKAICELAETPLLIETPIHEIIEHILSVSRAYDEDELLNDYFESEQIGRLEGNCTQKYQCEFSLFQKISSNQISQENK